jgi:hypothetical protein
MFSTVIDKLTAAFSKQLLPAAIYPLLVAGFFNVLLLAATNHDFRVWANQQRQETKVGTAAFNAAIAIIVLTVIAGILTTLNTFLRELLEGKHWPAFLSEWLMPIETERLFKFDAQLDDVARQHWQLRRVAGWDTELAKDRQTGHALEHAPVYCGLPRLAANALIRLRAERQRGELLDFQDLRTVREALGTALRSHNARALERGAQHLDRDHVEFVKLLEYARTRVGSEMSRVYFERQVSFGDNTVAATSLGNVANALSTYGLSRYGFNIDLLWSRLQKVLQADTTYHTIILDAKAQLDGLVLMFWLTAMTTLGWLLALPCVSSSISLLLLVAAAGPLLCTALYLVADTSYRGFAELVRSAVDLYRFGLFKQLHLKVPLGPAEERRAWERVNQWLGFASAPDSSYEHPLV